MNDLVWIIIWSVIGVAAFAWLWRGGYLLRFANYIRETREELRKCSWPTWNELKGSTVLIAVTIVLLGAFISVLDLIFNKIFTKFGV